MEEIAAKEKEEAKEKSKAKEEKKEKGKKDKEKGKEEVEVGGPRCVQRNFFSNIYYVYQHSKWEWWIYILLQFPSLDKEMLQFQFKKFVSNTGRRGRFEDAAFSFSTRIASGTQNL